MGKTLWRDHLEPNQGHGLATVGSSPSTYRQRQVSSLDWQKFLAIAPPAQATEIFSEVIPLPAVDLLVVLQAMEQCLQLPLNHFYWEHRRGQQGILSLGASRELILQDGTRFQAAQGFIDAYQRRIYGNSLPNIPYFCCGFTFFPEQQRNAPFPAGQVVIPRVQIFRQGQQCWLILNGDRQHRQQLPRLAAQLKAFIDMLPPGLSLPLGIRGTVCQASPGFVEGVAEALKLIDQGKLSKVVLAHALDVTTERAFVVVNALDNLRDRHPDCCVFSVQNRRGDTFIGASPERLLAIDQGTLITDALAGSAPRGATPAMDQQFAQTLLHSEKEGREHQAVANFLIAQLQELGLNPQVGDRTLLKLSNIQHLWTPISAQLTEKIHPLEVVAKLHPTPAVAGVPRAIACDHIQQSESFDRNLYAAPIGWLDAQGNAEFIVAIRSALIRGNHARLYGGAGIVAGSQPEKEYAEVQLKLTSLLDALT